MAYRGDSQSGTPRGCTVQTIPLVRRSEELKVESSDYQGCTAGTVPPVHHEGEPAEPSPRYTRRILTQNGEKEKPRLRGLWYE